MAINITCPGCLKRFQVSDQFAGRSGPCPGCKTMISIPALDDQVVIHEPENRAGATGANAKLDSITRRPSVFRKMESICIIVLLFLSITVSVLVRIFWSGAAELHFMHGMVFSLGLFLLAWPAAFVGYGVLKASETESFPRRALLSRATMVAGVYGLIALAFLLTCSLAIPTEDGRMLLIAILAVVCLTLAWVLPLAFLELEALQSLIHVAIYVSMATLYVFLANNMDSWLI